MLTFSEIHPWQGDDAVQQILVFPNKLVQANFQKLFDVELAEKGLEDADYKNKGAIYSLRAVKNGNGLYTPVIRCGFQGKLLWEDYVHCKTVKEALNVAVNRLLVSFFQDFFVFSSQLDHVMSDKTRQLLVFPNLEIRDKFYKENDQSETEVLNKGAIFILRPVKEDDFYKSKIYCGFTGLELGESVFVASSEIQAFVNCRMALKLHINDSLYRFMIF